MDKAEFVNSNLNWRQCCLVKKSGPTVEQFIVCRALLDAHDAVQLSSTHCVGISHLGPIELLGTRSIRSLHLCDFKLFGDWEAQLRRIMKMIAGGGLSITGSHSMCGDYLYSGHTVMLTLTYMFIKEYSSQRFRIYHWICWILSIVGIFCILLAHDHYTVDVVVAYYITSRLFWWYHTMANQQVLKEASTTNLLSHVWWYKPFQYFENNIQGTVPCSYHWPRSCQLPFRRKFGRPVEYSRLVSET